MANSIIQLRHSNVTGNTPSSLANGEIAINTYDGKIFYRGGVSNTVQEFSPTAQPSGLNGEIQFNDSGVLGSNSGLTFNKTTGLVTVPKLNVTSTSTFTGPSSFKGDITIDNSSGAGGSDEGGQLNFATATNNTSLNGPIAIDIYQNKIRFFETSGTNRGFFVDISTTAGGVGTDLLAGTTGSVTSVAGATGVVSNTQILSGIKTVSSTNSITFDQVTAANNGLGENFKVGDDAWIGDTNLANTIRIKGVQDASNGYIIFGNNDGKLLGRSGSGALTYDANTIWHAGNDGTGSGLDADLLDGLNSTEFARSSAESYANSAFTTANGAVAVNLTQNNSITAAFAAANTADTKATSAGIYANGAFAAANAATATDATQNTSITAAFEAANSAGIYANGAFTRANNSLSANSGGTVTGNVTIVGDIAITGNITVTGNAFSINVGSLVANDSVIVLAGSNYTSDTLDIGILAHYNAGTNAHTGFIRDSVTKEWYLFKEYTPEIGANNNININDPSFIPDALNANVHSNFIKIKEIEILPYINAAFDKANTEGGVNLTQNNSITAAFLAANTADDKATSAGSYANSAFAQANTDVTNVVVTAGVYGNTTTIPVITLAANGRITAISNAPVTGGGGSTTDEYARDTANSAGSYANSAFTKANSAFEAANNATANVYTFTGTGSCTAFTLSTTANPGINSLIVNIDGVLQLHSAYSISSNVITFTSAPVNNSSIEVQVVGSSQGVLDTSVAITTTGNITGGFIATTGAFYENSQNVTSNTTITAGRNAMSAGPITINSGITVVVPSGSRWVII